MVAVMSVIDRVIRAIMEDDITDLTRPVVIIVCGTYSIGVIDALQDIMEEVGLVQGGTGNPIAEIIV